MSSILFDKQMHDFGTVAENTPLNTIFTYIGTDTITAADFVVTCSCTSGIYYPQTREYHVGLKSNGIGPKQTNIIVKGSYYLILKANII
jgi:hypothetical protein